MADRTEQHTGAGDSLGDESVRRDPHRKNADILAEWPIDTAADPNEVPLEDFDVAHPRLFEDNVHWGWFARLRREAPVHWCSRSAVGPYWSITRYDDCVYLDSHHEQFSSDVQHGGIALGGVKDPDPEYTLPSFISMDQPDHDTQRMVVAPMFTAANLKRMEGLIRERAGAILDGLPRDEPFNWVRAVSVELTGQMLATLFDVPQEDRHKLIHWSDTVQVLGDPEHFETVADGFKELEGCLVYFQDLFMQRAQGNTQDDLISMLAQGAATKGLDPRVLLGTLMLLIVGGNDTTRNSISGGMLALHRNPDEFAKLRADPALVPKAVAEMIRWQSPVAHMARTAMEDVELGGQTIRAGDRVAMWYISGNRDETAIDDADRFIVDRTNARKHVGFGFGIHRCMGNRLAEMQLKTIWEEILQRFPRIELVDEPRYLRSSFIHGITDLQVVIPA